MKRRKVLDAKQMPTRLPMIGTLVWYLILDKFDAPGWLWGVMGTLFVLLWIAAVVGIWTQDSVEIAELK